MYEYMFCLVVLIFVYVCVDVLLGALHFVSAVCAVCVHFVCAQMIQAILDYAFCLCTDGPSHT